MSGGAGCAGSPLIFAVFTLRRYAAVYGTGQGAARRGCLFAGGYALETLKLRPPRGYVRGEPGLHSFRLIEWDKTRRAPYWATGLR